VDKQSFRDFKTDLSRRFDGSMSQAQRATTIEEFGKKSREPLILLISLKAGGVGLNL
jgi:DNA repair protein RAD5